LRVALACSRDKLKNGATYGGEILHEDSRRACEGHGLGPMSICHRWRRSRFGLFVAVDFFSPARRRSQSRQKVDGDIFVDFDLDASVDGT